MASYFITGKQGNGKSLIAVAKIFEYLAQGRPVATNLDIFLDRYLLPSSKKTLIRIPDKPSVDDLEMLGYANRTYDENKNGLLVLDELGAWFNTRSWQDQSRKVLIEWFLYLRKRGWDVFLLVQDINMVDAQLRAMLAEHLVVCRRLDRIKIPIIGNIIQFFGGKGLLPKIHRARVYFGETVNDLCVDTWNYRGVAFYSAYDTKQVFSPLYPHGVHSLLSPWHLKGRYLPPPPSFHEKLQDAWQQFLDAGQPPRPVPRPIEHPILARIAKLPCPEQRLQFYRRFEAAGAFLDPLERLSNAMRRELCGFA